MSHRLQVLIPESLDRRLNAAARRSRVSKGEWVRRAVEASLDGQKRTSGDPLAALAALSAPAADIGDMLAEIEAGRQ